MQIGTTIRLNHNMSCSFLQREECTIQRVEPIAAVNIHVSIYVSDLLVVLSMEHPRVGAASDQKGPVENYNRRNGGDRRWLRGSRITRGSYGVGRQHWSHGLRLERHNSGEQVGVAGPQYCVVSL